VTGQLMMRPGRNAPCHCGSGKKYKHCHLEADSAAETAHREAERPPNAAHDDAHPGVVCSSFDPLTHKTPAVNRGDFLVTVRNLAARGETAWLHIDAPIDLGRDQASVDAAVSYLRERHVEPDFWRDPPPSIVAAMQVLVDRLLGRGVCRAEQSGIRLRRYGQVEIESATDGGPFVAYVSGRGNMIGVVAALIRAVKEDGQALGVRDGLLGVIWPAIRVTRELVVRRLSLPEPLAERGAALTNALIEVISHVVDGVGDDGLSTEARRAMTALPYLVGLREARREPRRELEGMGLEGPAIDALAVQIEAASEGPAWVLRLADLAGDDWDTPDGYRAWVEAARSIPEAAGLLDSLEPAEEQVAREQAEATGEPEPARPESEAALVVPVAEGAAPQPAATLRDPVAAVPHNAFASVDAVVDAHAARRAEIRHELAGILDRRDGIVRARQELDDRMRELTEKDSETAVDEARATDELNGLAEEEARARHRAVLEVLATGSEALQVSAATWSAGIGTRDGHDQASLVEAERIVREFEEAERRDLLKSLPSGMAARLRDDAEQARGRLHEMLGGRDPIGVPVVVAAAADPALVLEVGLPFAGRDELEPGALHTALAVAIAGALTETVRSMEAETMLEEVEHESAGPGISVVRLRFAAPPPVTAEECAQFCAMLLSDLGRTNASLREAGLSIEARVEPDLESED
jgi:SEC-C motif